MHQTEIESKCITLDAHSTETAIVVQFASPLSNSDDKKDQSSYPAYSRKIIKLKDLTDDVDIGKLSWHIVSTCNIIPENKVAELEQLLYYLQTRQSSCCLDSSTVPFESVCRKTTGIACIEDLEQYCELLYENTAEKIRGADYILDLSGRRDCIERLVENEILVGLLARVFREEWKKNLELAAKTAAIFLNFSKFVGCRSILSKHKIGALCIQIVEHELKRWSVWRDELKISNTEHSRKLDLAIQKLQKLIHCCLNVLFNLAENLKAEFKMVNRGMIALLSKCIIAPDSSEELLLDALNFLLKLSVFHDNFDAMKSSAVLENVLNLVKCGSGILREGCMKFLFNLSFDCVLRNQMIGLGLVTFLAPFIEDDECALNLFYQLSIDDDAKAMVTFTDVIPQLLERVLSGEASQTHIAILVNIATEKRNAQLICGREGKGLDAIMGRAIEQQNLLLFKLLRNLASHTGSTQIMFSKWVQKLLCLATGQTTSPPASLSFRIGVESIRILSQLHLNNWDEFIQKNNMVSWVGDKINTSQGKNGSTDLLLQVVILSGTMALQSCAARLLVPLVDSFLRFLAEEQEDDEMVIQIVYFFYSLLLHEETNADLTSEDSPVGAYLIDLMHDKNEKIRELCERTLDLFAMTSDVWSRRMDAERFCWHNAQWLEMVTGNDCTMSCDSALSEPPSLFNDIFETEELAEMN